MFHVSAIVTTKQKPRADPQNTEKGEPEYTTTKNNQFTKVGRKQRERNNGNTKPLESPR